MGSITTAISGNAQHFTIAKGYNPDQQKHLLIWRNWASPYQIKGKTVTVSGTTLSYGTEYDMDSLDHNDNYPHSVYDTTEDKHVVWWWDTTDQKQRAAVIQMVGTSLVVNSAQEMGTDSINGDNIDNPTSTDFSDIWLHNRASLFLNYFLGTTFGG